MSESDKLLLDAQIAVIKAVTMARSKIYDLEQDRDRLQAALEKINFDDKKIIEFMDKTPTATVMSILKVFGDIARKALDVSASETEKKPSSQEAMK